MTPRRRRLLLGRLTRWLQGKERDAVVGQDLLDVRFPLVESPLQPRLQLPVALLDPHRELEGHGLGGVVLEGNDLERGRRMLLGEVAHHRPPGDRHVDGTGKDVLEHLLRAPGRIGILRVEEEPVAHHVLGEPPIRKGVVGGGVHVHADLELLEGRVVQRAQAELPVAAIRQHVRGTVVRLRPEDRVEPLRDRDQDVAAVPPERVPDHPHLGRPPEVVEARPELLGDDLPDLVLETLKLAGSSTEGCRGPRRP